MYLMLWHFVFLYTFAFVLLYIEKIIVENY